MDIMGPALPQFRKKTGKYSRSGLATDPASTFMEKRKRQKVDLTDSQVLLLRHLHHSSVPPTLKSSFDGTTVELMLKGNLERDK